MDEAAGLLLDVVAYAAPQEPSRSTPQRGAPTRGMMVGSARLACRYRSKPLRPGVC